MSSLVYSEGQSMQGPGQGAQEWTVRMGNRDRICGKSGKGSSPEDSIQFPIQRNPENWRSFAFVFWDWLYVVWIATLTAGCLVRGIITISGRSSSYDRDYWFAGVVFLLWRVEMNCVGYISENAGEIIFQ